MKVHIHRANKPRALENLPPEEKCKEDRNPNVRSDEVIDVEGVAEGVEAVEDDDDGEEGESAPGNVGLEGGSEHQGLAIDALGLEGLVELDVGDADRAPGEEAGDGGKVLEPFERFVGAGGGGRGHVG